VLNNLAGQSGLADAVFIFLGKYLIYVMFFALAFLLILWNKPWQKKIRAVVLALIISVISYLIVVFIFHPLWPRIRPFEDLMNVNQLISETGLSFPSKHALFSFLFATFVFGIHKRIGFWLFVCAVLIALGRVLVGVHYPLDVLVGAVFGFLIGSLAIFSAKKIRVL
jgi:undecaprenyl-diphosphatase